MNTDAEEFRLRLNYTGPQEDIFYPKKPRRYTIIPKGRRFGATHGAANFAIESALVGMPVLWGDTTFKNIELYLDEFFRKTMRKNRLHLDLNRVTMQARIGEGTITFRSEDNPSNWEGQKYRRTILNEAGLILSNRRLYTESLLPMLMDYPDAEVYALGVPKGKMVRNGQEHVFYSMWEKVLEGHPDYRGHQYSSYDNPTFTRAQVDKAIEAMADLDPSLVPQEIYGEFIDLSSGRPFAHAWHRDIHVRPVKPRPTDLHHFSLDLNVEPFTCSAAYIYQTSAGQHFETFNEASLMNAGVKQMAEWILSVCPIRHLIRLTGDRNGDNRAVGQDGLVRMFRELQKALGISDAQRKLPANPSHVLSREHSNYVLGEMRDPDDSTRSLCIVDPRCTRFITDMHTVSVDNLNRIIKGDRSNAAKQADALDTWRYFINTYLREWVDQDRAFKSMRASIKR